MVNAYFISGLGADERAFRHIRLPACYQPIYLPWVPPKKNESLREYAIRMAGGIDPVKPFVLIGLSLGGMVASEIARTCKPKTLVLISSIPTSSHLPFYFKVVGALRLYRLVPIRLLQHASLVKRFFTTETDEDRKLLRQMIHESDPAFIRWAMGAILNWQNQNLPEGLLHIHGTRDLLLPKRFTKPTHTVRNAGHLMVLNRAEDVNKILMERL